MYLVPHSAGTSTLARTVYSQASNPRINKNLTIYIMKSPSKNHNNMNELRMISTRNWYDMDGIDE